MNKRATNSHGGSFVEIEHTADLAIELTAGNLTGLFATSAEALFSLIADSDSIEPRDEVTVSASGADIEELLHAWLSELLARFNLQGFVGRHCRIIRISDTDVEGSMTG